ncbi:PRTRC system protein F [Massilia aerilata]|uniref:PRTRC system protein F n=1 Tax=Massilia aerilata TaxID=453817 RepID=A0ABW0S1F0_9BURK
MLPLAALALPQLAAEIPTRYVIPGVDALMVPLTIALLEADVITAPMLRTPRNALLVDVIGEPEKQLSARALSHWWTKLIREHSCKFFRWSLQVQQLDDTNYDKLTTAWFCFSRMGDDIPRFALAKGIERLELLKEGFGQTVLAVLRDAVMLLPESFNPWFALDWADQAYWRESRDDAELLEMRREDGNYKTVEELLENEHVVTRAVFFAELPEWVCAPKRTLSREAIAAAAGDDQLAHQAIELCDQVHGLVNRPDFVLHPSDKGAYRTGNYPIDGCMVLLWKPFDVIGETIDDYLNDLGQCGEYTDFIDASPVPVTAAGVREFMTLTEQTLQVAVLVEKLILLLGEKY